MRLRFAPSPTGKLHVGNARMALINYYYALKLKGTFILRIDDTDDLRSTQEFADQIEEDLTWLGIRWTELYQQKHRFDAYKKAQEKLISDGFLYPCYETPEELNLKRKRLLIAGKPPIYDRMALTLTDAQKRTYQQEGRKPHWRFKLREEEICWHDLVRGKVSFQGADLGDPIVIREDGRFLYMLPSTVDDIDMQITDVLRGDDHVTNTALQIQMFQALGGEMPRFGHFSLLAGAQGEALSKRLKSLSLDMIRESGILPESLVCVLLKLGTSDPIKALERIEDLIEEFDFSKFGRATAKFNMDDVERINGQIIHKKSYDQVNSALAVMGIDGELAEHFWLAVRANINKLSDAADFWPLVNGKITPKIEDHDFIAQALKFLPENISDDAWSEWTDQLKAQTGRKGKNLFMPLRQALTGMDKGPEMQPLLNLMGRQRIVHRLEGKEA